MKLVQAQVERFKNIIDSSKVNIDPNITCLVGKNESGKTSFLQAMHRLLPAKGKDRFSIPDHYPAWLEKLHRRQGEDLENFRPVSAKFEMSEEQFEELKTEFGAKSIQSKFVQLRRNYKNTLIYSLDVDEAELLKFFFKEAEGLFKTLESKFPKTFAEFNQMLTEISKKTLEGEEQKSAREKLISLKKEKIGDCKSASELIYNYIEDWIPKFFYFSDYSSLPGIIKIKEVLGVDKDNLNDRLQTARALLELGRTEDDYLTNPDYERRKRELENVSNLLTQEILEYWSTNKEIRVDIDVTQQTEQRPNGQAAVLNELRIRLYDMRHMLSLPFDERSSGFRWFFSFLAAFSEFENQEDPIIILLDEPGLNLHARAQKDFLRFINERLGAKCQVIYSTHSPFMIQPENLERVRLVEDYGRDRGSVVIEQALATDPDTLFPLQGALGYDLAQHLFVAPHNLVVEGIADFIYLSTLSDHLRDMGKPFLDPKWSIVPVGGADLVPSFVALLGHHLDVTVLVDSQKAGHQRLFSIADRGLLEKKRILLVGDILGLKLADIEDAFNTKDYLSLYNETFKSKLVSTDLTGNDGIVARIERKIGAKYDHGKPADFMLRNRDKFLKNISEETLTNFAKIFEAINKTL